VLSSGASLQEVLIYIRAVDGCVAASTIPERLKAQSAMRHICGLGIYVALQTQKAALGAQQEMTLDGPVWTVTSSATLHTHCWVLVHIRATLLRVTAGTNLKVDFPQLRDVRDAALRLASDITGQHPANLISLCACS